MKEKKHQRLLEMIKSSIDDGIYLGHKIRNKDQYLLNLCNYFNLKKYVRAYYEGNVIVIEDESGISGTGRIAQGFIFDNGKVALTWLSEHPSVTIYDSIGEVHAIHGHGGKTEVIMEPDYKRAFNEMKSVLDNFNINEILKEKLPVEGQASKLLKEKE